MAKRNVRKTTPHEHAYLKKQKDTFKKELEDRINQGKEMLEMKITSESVLNEFNQKYALWNNYNLELLKQSFKKPDNIYWKSYKDAGSLGVISVSTLGAGPSPGERIGKARSNLDIKIKNLRKLLQKVDLLKTIEIKNSNQRDHSPEPDKPQVFIVHGCDEPAKVETAGFIEQLGFQPIILHEQVSSEKTIIEKIEQHPNAGFGIILYTPCDIGAGKSESSNLKPRAEQNVVFEHGYLIGKIGKENVCALIIDDVEIPNDIPGVVFISMKNDWKFELAKQLKSSGYNVDMNVFF